MHYKVEPTLITLTEDLGKLERVGYASGPLLCFECKCWVTIMCNRWKLEKVSGDDELEEYGCQYLEDKINSERTWMPPNGLSVLRSVHAILASLSNRSPSTIDTVTFVGKVLTSHSYGESHLRQRSTPSSFATFRAPSCSSSLSSSIVPRCHCPNRFQRKSGSSSLQYYKQRYQC
jgi:hypothetical protein